jgi:hypothetical protein
MTAFQTPTLGLAMMTLVMAMMTLVTTTSSMHSPLFLKHPLA